MRIKQWLIESHVKLGAWSLHTFSGINYNYAKWAIRHETNWYDILFDVLPFIPLACVLIAGAIILLTHL